MLDSLSTAIVELDGQGCVRDMNAAAEHCLAIGRERAHGSRFHDIEGIPDTLSQAISATTSEQRGRHLRECELAGGWFDCTIQPMPEHHMLLELYDLKNDPNELENRFNDPTLQKIRQQLIDHHISEILNHPKKD